MPHEWKVGELARMTGLSIRTLRYYDQIGLLTPSGRTGAGYRLYTGPDLERLQQILSLKELGLSLEQIKSVLAENAIGLYEIVTMQMDRLRESIRNQQKLLFELERVAAHLRDSKPPTVCHDSDRVGRRRIRHDLPAKTTPPGRSAHRSAPFPEHLFQSPHPLRPACRMPKRC